MGLKILSFGYYGHQNAGDDLLRNSIEYIFRDHRLCVSSWEPSIDAMNEADLVILGGGSLWPDFKFFRRSVAELKRLKTPFCIFGISAKRADDEIAETTNYLINKSAYFHVRDHQTKEILGGSDKIKVGADLFWWAPWNPTDSGVVKQNQVALALRSSKNTKWDPNDILSVVQELGLNPVPFPFYFGSVEHDSNAEVNDPEFLAKLLNCNNVSVPWTLSPALESEIVVAMRYHAVLVAVRLGRLVIGIDCHPKISSFFNDANLSELCVNADDPEALKTALILLRERGEYYRSRLKVLSDKLTQLGMVDYRSFSSFVSDLKASDINKLPWWRRLL